MHLELKPDSRIEIPTTDAFVLIHQYSSVEVSWKDIFCVKFINPYKALN
jgi:hypothetical protein